MEKGAIQDTSRFYQYSMHRRWEPRGDPVLFVTGYAPEDNDEIAAPLIRIAQRAGYGALLVGSLFGYRGENFDELLRERRLGEDLVGAENDEYLRKMARQAALIVLAYPPLPIELAEREAEVLALLKPFHLHRLSHGMLLPCRRGDTHHCSIRLSPHFESKDVPF